MQFKFVSLTKEYARISYKHNSKKLLIKIGLNKKGPEN